MRCKLIFVKFISKFINVRYLSKNSRIFHVKVFFLKSVQLTDFQQNFDQFTNSPFLPTRIIIFSHGNAAQ